MNVDALESDCSSFCRCDRGAVGIDVFRTAAAFVGSLILCSVVCAQQSVAVNHSSGAASPNNSVVADDVLTLVNGDTVAGHLIGRGEGDVMQWQASSFAEPFAFEFSSIKAIRFATQDVDPPEKSGSESLVLELTNGDSIYGQIQAWNEQRVSIHAAGFGELNLRPASIRSLFRSDRDRETSLALLSGSQDWEDGSWKFDQWRRDGNHLWTQTLNASLTGKVRIPQRSLIDLEISWSGRANWGIRFGGNEGQAPFVRLDAKDGRLIATKDIGVGEPTPLIDLRQKQSLRLSLCIDASTHQMRCFDDRDRLLGSLDTNVIDRPAYSVTVINTGDSLRLEQFRVSEWRGALPESMVGTASLALTDGSLVSGQIRQFDPEEKTLKWRVADFQSDAASIPLSRVDVVRVRRFATMPERPQCALFLVDGQRISGDLQTVNTKEWVLSGRHFDRPVNVSRTRVRSMVVFNNDSSVDRNRVPSGRPGRLQLGSHIVNGHLVSTESNEASVLNTGEQPALIGLRWHPYGSQTSSALTADASGRIVYRESAAQAGNSLTAQAMEQQQQRLQKQRRGLNFGELFLRRIDNAGATEPEKDAHVIHTRLGDAISCRVESIDETGLRVSTALSDDQWVSHEQIKAVEFAANSPPPELDAEKRDRLLTIPRLQKMLPPTHLLCSYNGDFLRCRLMEMDGHRVVVEVRAKSMEIPRERIAQIIWFHPDEWNADDSVRDADQNAIPGSNADTGSAIKDRSRTNRNVQVLKRDGKRVTFSLDRVEANTITGQSELVGPCRFTLNEVDQIIFGDQIAREVSSLAYNQWKLQPAIEPLVMQSNGSGESQQAVSPLVGKPAPDVYLEQLDGTELRLSSYQDKILILDFWASWCAPCTTTMPLIEAIVADQDPDQVILVTVNVGETLGRVSGFVERQQLSSQVARDVDGAASEKFGVTAIPQWVVIDQTGKVSSTYTGGGQASVVRLEKAITDLLDVLPGNNETAKE